MPVHSNAPTVTDGGEGEPLRITAMPEVVLDGVRFFAERPDDAQDSELLRVFVKCADGLRRSMWVRRADLFD